MAKNDGVRGKKRADKSAPRPRVPTWAKWVAGFIAAPVLVGVALFLLPRILPEAQGVAVSPAWPALEACDFTAVAAGPGAEPPAISTTDTVDRAAVALEDGGGAWASGNLSLLVTPEGDKQVTVRALTPRVEPVDDVPEWVFMPIAQCGDLTNREFELDLDAASLRDLGVIGEVADDDTPPPVAVGSDLFVVDSETTASVVVRSFACKGSYDFWIDIAYTVSGSTTIEHQEVGPFRVYAGDALLTGGDVEFFRHPEAGEPRAAFQCGAN